MKKILFVVPTLSGGGAERVVSIWANELSKLNCNVFILVFYRVKDEYNLDSNVNVTSLYENEETYHKHSKVSKTFALRKELKKIKADIIIPFIVYVGIWVMLVSINLPGKIIQTVRMDPKYKKHSRLMKWASYLSIVFAYRCFVQNCQQLFFFPKWLRKKIVIFPNPIANEFTDNKKEFEAGRIRKIITVGRLAPQKNHKLLIDAFYDVYQHNKDISLTIYGEGSMQVELESYINNFGLTEVISLPGRTKNIISELLKHDLFILSSDFEGMPNALMEAMALGLPVISTDCDTGPSELIEDEHNGLLVPVGDKEKLITGIENMISNPKHAIVLGSNARNLIINEYSAQRNALRLYIYLESLT